MSATITRETDWERVFAWMPVADQEGRTYWLQYVERKRIPNDYRLLGDMTPCWTVYRAPQQ